MEGRNAPPKAEHNFPNKPDMTKFWGPLSRAMFRSFGAVMGTYMILAGINLYLTRHEKGPWGMDLTMTREEFNKRQEILDSTGMTKYPDLSGVLSFKQRDNHLSLGGINMKFDESIKFDIPNIPREAGNRYRE